MKTNKTIRIEQSLKIIVTLSLIGMFAACSSAVVRTLPGENGVNKIIAEDIEKTDAQKAAADAAREYCEKEDQRLVVIKEDIKYNGTMDEGTRSTVRQASKVASMVGFQNRSNDPGQFGKPSAVESVGDAGTAYTSSKDYTATIEFKCR
jgi:hypothetical protein